ncbi:MAG: hypothetical protein GF393_11560 [Armatimonadia bacterium]|nr:hypothetical protein [Armatimonadia bacterium]
MRVILTAIGLIAIACTQVLGAEIAEEDVLLKTEIESWGETRGLTPVQYAAASGGIAMSMSADALAVGALELEAGEYSLVLWLFGPAPDADAFFVDVAGERTRLVGTNDSWGTLALPFTVREAGGVAIAIIGQEPGMTIDRIAVVRGGYDQTRNSPAVIDFADIPGETAGDRVSLAEIDRLATPCRLAEPLQEPLAAGEHTVYAEDFEAACEGIVGEHEWIDGPFGRALVLQMPDGRFDVDARELDIAGQGTIEWWVKTREAARIWWDQGWHYFLHAAPAEPGGTQLDLHKHIRALALSITLGGQPYALTEGTHETATVNVGGVDNEAWHHVLVSWEFSGERQYMWVMVDGNGMQKFFPESFGPADFARLEFGNTPSDWKVPYLPLDGAIDGIRISNVSIRDRLAE